MTPNQFSSGEMSRRQFIRRAGLAAAALGASAAGLRGVAGAATIGDDPYGLLDRAYTLVRPEFNQERFPSLGQFTSKVTAIKFHSNVVVGTNRDGSPKYVASYMPGGLVDEPVGVEKVVNGVAFTEYTGEISGYINRSNIPGTEMVYGPIDEFGVDHTAEPVSAHVRGGLKGICFILKIPTYDWNGVLVDYHTGGWPNSAGIYNNQLDEIYLVSQGYAHVSSFASGFESPTDTNHNNDEYWTYVVTSGLLGTGASTCRLRATGSRSSASTTNMYTRDFAAVMKNLCKYAKGKTPDCTYFSTRSLVGGVALALDTGRRSTDMRYYGNNYVQAFGNCPDLPNGDPNPDYDPNAPMVFDGFLVHSPASDDTQADLNPMVPVSPAPMIVLAGETDFFTRFGGLLLPYYAYRAKYELSGHETYGDLWPEPKDTFFNYSFEHFPHFPQLTSIYALAKNGGGKYACIDANGNLTFNNERRGKELDGNWGRMVDTFDYLGIPFSQTLLGMITYLNYSAPCSLGGVCHQLLDNVHQYVTKGTKPPVSNIDPYLLNNNVYSKSPAWDATPPRPNSDVIDIGTVLPGFGATTKIDISTYAGGLYRTVINYIAAHGQEVLKFNRMTWRTPDDAARLGLYRSCGPLFEYVDRPFTEAELIDGVSAMDWNGEPLVTMTLPNGRSVPAGGYRNHGGYVSAVAQAVRSLVINRLYDRYVGTLHVAAAAQADYPFIVSKNLGEIMRNYREDLKLMVEGSDPFGLVPLDGHTSG